MPVEAFVQGRPSTKNKTRARKAAEREWHSAVVSQTADLERISGPCELEVEFLLEPESSPPDHPYGPDLDNLLNTLLDGLKETVLRDAPGGDSAIIKVVASKCLKPNDKPAGAKITLRLSKAP